MSLISWVLSSLNAPPNNSWILKAYKLKRKFLGVDKHLREEYLRNNCQAMLLQIGGGSNLLAGWLNTDLDIFPGVMQLDATKPYPFEDETFDFIFTEHMIEHVPYGGGNLMLCECFRVLKKGGIIRVTTPDLRSLVRLYDREFYSLEEQYFSFFKKEFVPDDYPSTVATILNLFFRLWGHQFIYDEETLTNLMISVGFGNIESKSLGKSAYPELQNLEHETRYPDQLLSFESICLEGIKKD